MVVINRTRITIQYLVKLLMSAPAFITTRVSEPQRLIETRHLLNNGLKHPVFRLPFAAKILSAKTRRCICLHALMYSNVPDDCGAPLKYTNIYVSVRYLRAVIGSSWQWKDGTCCAAADKDKKKRSAQFRVSFAEYVR